MPLYGELRTTITAEQTIHDLENCMRKWGVTEWDAPRGSRSVNQPASVWFVLNGEHKVMHCERFKRYSVNLRALYFVLDELRLASQRGILEEFRQFFEQLPPPSGEPVTQSPYELLGVAPSAPVEVAEAAYRALAKRAHPDTGGSNERMSRLNVAIATIRREKGQG